MKREGEAAQKRGGRREEERSRKFGWREEKEILGATQ
jgi:hypothetical protein